MGTAKGVVAMVLLRRVIGDALRARRLSQHRTLREVSTAANVSLGYLSEIERGHKEASSELLHSICEALGAKLSELLREVGDTLHLAEQMADVLPPDTDAVPAKLTVPTRRTPAGATAGTPTREKATAIRGAAADLATTRDGDVTVSVRHDGPLRTTLTAHRNRTATPGQRRAEVFV